MKNRTTLCSLLVVVFFAISIVFSFSSMAASQPKSGNKLVLRWSDVGPSSGLRPVYMKKAADEIEKATNGRVHIDFYWSNSLVNVKENVRAVQKGIADGAWTGPVYHPAEYPIATGTQTVLYTPHGDDAEYITKAYWEMWDELKPFRDEVEKWGSTVWMMFPYDSYGCFANKPIRKMEDIKGMRLRVSGEGIGKMVSAAGGSPGFFASSEVYSSLEKGVIDGAIVGYSWGKGYRIYEVSKYLNLLDVTMIGCCYGIVSFNALNKMSEQDRKTFMEIGRRVSLELGKATRLERQDLIGAMEKEGVELVSFPDEERQKWADLPQVRTFIPAWLETQEKAGRGKESRQMVELFLKKFDLTHLMPKK